MGKSSGFTTLLMLLMAAIIVLLVVSTTVGGFDSLWARLTGHPPAPDPAPAHEVTTRRPMTTTDGM